MVDTDPNVDYDEWLENVAGEEVDEFLEDNDVESVDDARDDLLDWVLESPYVEEIDYEQYRMLKRVSESADLVDEVTAATHTDDLLGAATLVAQDMAVHDLQRVVIDELADRIDE